MSPRTSPIRDSLVAVGLAALVASACTTGDHAPAHVPAKLSEAAESLLVNGQVVGGRDQTNDNGLLYDVKYARVLPDGRGVVAADDAPPLLRLFDSTGHLMATALPRGDGPREAKRVWGLDVSPGGELLVLSSRGFREFAWTGDSLLFVATHPTPPGRLLISVGSRCGSGWVAYTPTNSPGKRVPILVDSQRDSIGRLVWISGAKSESETARTWIHDWGQITWDDTKNYLRHPYAAGAPILAVSCEGGVDTARVVRRTTGAGSAEEVRNTSGGAVVVYTYPDTTYIGFAVRAGWLFESERVRQDRNTRFTIVSVSPMANVKDRRSVRVPGVWAIMDSDDSEVLFYAPEPDPRLIFVPLKALVTIVRNEIHSQP